MTNADVQRVLEQARSRGVECDDYHCRVFLASKEMLARAPENSLARDVLANYSTWLNGGAKKVSFKEFFIPEQLLDTDEEKERWKK